MKAVILDRQEQKLGDVRHDEPVPREGEICIFGVEMYKVDSVQHEYLATGRRVRTIVLCQWVANIGV